MSIFEVVGEISVGGSVFGLKLVVIAGSLIVVMDDEGDGGSGGAVLIYAREDLDFIGFLSLGGDFGLTGSASVELGLDFLDGDG